MTQIPLMLRITAQSGKKIVRNVLCLEVGCLDSGCHYFMKAEAEHRSNEYIGAPS
jgi:hypothetical protein